MLKFLYQIKALLPQAFGSLIKSQFKPMRIFPLTDINLNQVLTVLKLKHIGVNSQEKQCFSTGLVLFCICSCIQHRFMCSYQISIHKCTQRNLTTHIHVITPSEDIVTVDTFKKASELFQSFLAHRYTIKHMPYPFFCLIIKDHMNFALKFPTQSLTNLSRVYSCIKDMVTYIQLQSHCDAQIRKLLFKFYCQVSSRPVQPQASLIFMWKLYRCQSTCGFPNDYFSFLRRPERMQPPPLHATTKLFLKNTYVCMWAYIYHIYIYTFIYIYVK